MIWIVSAYVLCTSYFCTCPFSKVPIYKRGIKIHQVWSFAHPCLRSDPLHKNAYCFGALIHFLKINIVIPYKCFVVIAGVSRKMLNPLTSWKLNFTQLEYNIVPIWIFKPLLGASDICLNTPFSRPVIHAVRLVCFALLCEPFFKVGFENLSHRGHYRYGD